MAASLQPKHVALRICKTLYALTGEDLHWVDIAEVCRRLDEPRTAAFDAALEHGRDHGLLACGPPPVRSVMLTHKGVLAARGKFRKSHRESG
jgi:hypothetical protein